jgi:hypothetical protein
MRGEKLFYEVIYEAVFLTSLKFYYFGPSFKRMCHQIQYQLPVQQQLSGKIRSVSNLVVQNWGTLDIGLTL